MYIYICMCIYIYIYIIPCMVENQEILNPQAVRAVKLNTQGILPLHRMFPWGQ